MNVSQRGLLEICEHEGIVPGPYLDSKGILTYGVGHTAAAGDPDPATLPRGMPADLDAAVDGALALFRVDVAKYEARVARAIKVPLEPHQFDALVSWDFNTGGATFRSKSGAPAQLITQVNAGNLSGDGFMGWLRPPELRKRRTAEMELFRSGDYDANGTAIPIWKVDANGRLRGMSGTINGLDVLRRMGHEPEPELVFELTPKPEDWWNRTLAWLGQ